VRSVRGEWWTDDGQLLALLGAALDEARCVPADFVRAGQAVYRPPNLDAELAALIYDSEHELAVTRADTATLRALTFSSPGLTIELQVTGGGLLGQLVPAGPAVVEIQTRDGTAGETTADGVGCFTVHKPPRVPFRLRCRVGTRVDVLTSWITL
jgi:hypothetical protein